MRRCGVEWFRNMYGVSAEELNSMVRFEEVTAKKITPENIILGKQEESSMLEGNYKIALCRFLDTKTSPPSAGDWDSLVTGEPCGKQYAYAAFPEDEIGRFNYALVIANGDLKVVAVEDIIDKAEWDGADVTKELICRVNPEPYKHRKECRKQAKKLKNQMDKIVKESQSVLIYETLAKNNPVLAAMLDQYKNLTGIGENNV